MNTKNSVTIMLMSLSIILLLVLQGLWLQNSYEKAFLDLRRDTNFLFRNTIFTIRDSLFLKNVKPLQADSLPPSEIRSVQIFNNPGKDSMRVSLKSSVQLFVNSKSPNDSIIHAIRPMVHHYARSLHDGKSFVIKLAPDTLNLDTLNQVFGEALNESNLPVRFQIIHTLTPPEEMSTFRMRVEHTSGEPREINSILFGDTIRLDVVRLNPLSRYSASVFGFKGYIFKSISPQILLLGSVF